MKHLIQIVRLLRVEANLVLNHVAVLYEAREIIRALETKVVAITLKVVKLVCMCAREEDGESVRQRDDNTATGMP